MSGGFANPLTTKSGDLVKSQVDSPNYVAGTSGWIIRKDGTAEFNNLVIRGTIELTPATVGMTANSIWWNDGYATPGQIVQDSTANIFINAGNSGGRFGSLLVAPDTGTPSEIFTRLFAERGSIAATVDTFLLSQGIQTQDNNSAGHGRIFIANNLSTEVITLQGAKVILSSPTTEVSGQNFITDTGVNFTVGHSNPLKIGPGPAGFYYYEDITLSAQILATATQTQLVGLVSATLISDYLSPLLGGGGTIWFSPVDGVYTFTITVRVTAGITGRVNIGANVNGTGAIVGDMETTLTAAAIWSTCFTRFISASTQIVFNALQSSSASKTINTVGSLISVYRNP